MDWTLITTLFSIICGSGTVVTYVLYRKQEKRSKTAEAFGEEVAALKNTVEILQKQIEFQKTRLDDMQKMVISKDAYISQLTGEKHVLEIKHAKNKSATNEAYGCKHIKNASACPVLIRRKENEEEYLKSISKEEKK